MFIQGICSTIVYLSVMLSSLVKQCGDLRLTSAKWCSCDGNIVSRQARTETAAEGVNVWDLNTERLLRYPLIQLPSIFGIDAQRRVEFNTAIREDYILTELMNIIEYNTEPYTPSSCKIQL